MGWDRFVISEPFISFQKQYITSMKHNWSDTPYRRYTLPTFVSQQNLHFHLRPIAWTMLDAQRQHLTTYKPKQLFSRQWSSASYAVSDHIYKPPDTWQSAYRSNLKLPTYRSRPSKHVWQTYCQKICLCQESWIQGSLHQHQLLLSPLP